MSRVDSERLRVLTILALALAAFGVAFHNDFINWDDPQYITTNRVVWGLSWERIEHVFTSFHLFNYNPLHLVSYMIDHELWGLEPTGFFLSNVLLHAGAALCVWHIFKRLDGRATLAWFVTIVFLLHPTRCESVVWLSERKDVLSGLFALLCLLVYVAGADAARRIDPKRPLSPGAYAGCLGLFALALLSKSQVVTLPFVLVAIGLLRRRALRTTLLEQAPMLALSIVFTIVTLRAHATSYTGSEAGGIDLVRPLVAYPRYVLHTLLPFGLSPIYDLEPPSIRNVALWVPGLAAAGLVVWSAIRSWRGRRVFLAAATIFVILILPVSGIVHNQIVIADRYLYLAILAPAWLLGLIVARRPVVIAATAVLLGVLTNSYAAVWRSPETFWTRVLDRFPGCSVAQANLGSHLLARGRVEEAERLFREDVAERPAFRESYFGLAEIERGRGRVEASIELFEELLERRPEPSSVLRYAAFLLETRGPDAGEEVIARFGATVDLPESFALEQLRFRIALARGRPDAAREHALRSVRLAPLHEEGWYHLGLVEERLGSALAAAVSYERAASLNPRASAPREARARLAMAAGRHAEALEWLEDAGDSPAALNMRAVCLASLGRTDDALASSRAAIGRAPLDWRYWANHARIASAVGRSREADESRRVSELRRAGAPHAVGERDGRAPAAGSAR